MEYQLIILFILNVYRGWPLHLRNISSSNLESDNWHLSGLNTFPAMEKSHSTGTDEAVIDRYLQARIHKSGYVFWFCFQNISGSEYSTIVGCAKYSVTCDGVCVTGGNGALAFIKRKSLHLFVGGDAACVWVSRSGFNSWTRSLRSDVTIMTSSGVHHANFQRGSRAAAIWKFSVCSNFVSRLSMDDLNVATIFDLYVDDSSSISDRRPRT